MRNVESRMVSLKTKPNETQTPLFSEFKLGEEGEGSNSGKCG